jgi:MFS family permease
MFGFLKQSTASNISKLYWASFFEAMFFAEPIYILYFISSGLNLEQIGILISILFITQVIFEIPSSIWADRYSRKNILVIGMIFWVVAQIFFLGNSFIFFVLMSIFSGISSAFASGTESAITYDTLLNLGREKEYDHIKSKIQGIFFAGRAVAVIIGVLAYTYDHKLPFLLSIITAILAVVILFLLKEPKFNKSSGTHLKQIKEGLKFLLANEKVWLIILVFSLISASSDILYSYYQPVLDLAGLPIIYFIYVYLGASIASLVGAASYTKLAKGLSNNKILVFYLLSVLAVSLGFAIGNLVLILPLILLLPFCFGSYGVYVTSLINEIVPSSHRATTISIQSLISRIMMGVLIIIIGRIANNYSIFWGMVFNAGVVLVAFVGFLYVRIKNRKLAKLINI